MVQKALGRSKYQPYDAPSNAARLSPSHDKSHTLAGKMGHWTGGDGVSEGAS